MILVRDPAIIREASTRVENLEVERICRFRNAFVSIFFFQAEDGIRDLVRSRRLGDVYKRQFLVVAGNVSENDIIEKVRSSLAKLPEGTPSPIEPVSYTHLTLPTSDLV